MRERAMVTINDFQGIITAYHKETDRAAAILAAEFANEYLAGFMQSFMVSDSKCAELFAEMAPLGAFAARAHVAHAFGLITSEIAADLRYVRKIRNVFAHDISVDLSFSTPQVKDLCANFSMVQPILQAEGGEYLQTNPRNQYLVTIGIAVMHMHSKRLAHEKELQARDA